MNEKLKTQIAEKDKTVSTMQRTIATLEVKLSGRDGNLDQVDLGEQQEIDAMHEALRRIAQEVISDADQSMLDDVSTDPELSTSMKRVSSPLRSPARSPARSPNRGRQASLSPGRRSPMRSRSPGFADSTFAAVQAALNKRQLQVSELKARLAASKDHSHAQHKQMDNMQNELRRHEEQVMTLKEDTHTA